MSAGQFSIGEITIGELLTAEAGAIAVEGARGKFQLSLMPEDIKEGRGKRKAPSDNWVKS